MNPGQFTLPACIGGRRACPPEDCGGPRGYAHLLEALVDPEHEEHESLLEWTGEVVDPDAFSVGEVTFTDPKRGLACLRDGVPFGP